MHRHHQVNSARERRVSGVAAKRHLTARCWPSVREPGHCHSSHALSLAREKRTARFQLDEANCVRFELEGDNTSFAFRPGASKGGGVSLDDPGSDPIT